VAEENRLKAIAEKRLSELQRTIAQQHREERQKRAREQRQEQQRRETEQLRRAEEERWTREFKPAPEEAAAEEKEIQEVSEESLQEALHPDIMAFERERKVPHKFVLHCSAFFPFLFGVVRLTSHFFETPR
jgi:hypothetical protein